MKFLEAIESSSIELDYFFLSLQEQFERDEGTWFTNISMRYLCKVRERYNKSEPCLVESIHGLGSVLSSESNPISTTDVSICRVHEKTRSSRVYYKLVPLYENPIKLNNLLLTYGSLRYTEDGKFILTCSLRRDELNIEVDYNFNDVIFRSVVLGIEIYHNDETLLSEPRLRLSRISIGKLRVPVNLLAFANPENVTATLTMVVDASPMVRVFSIKRIFSINSDRPLSGKSKLKGLLRAATLLNDSESDFGRPWWRG